jgi:uncharacterized protein YkwD
MTAGQKAHRLHRAPRDQANRSTRHSWTAFGAAVVAAVVVAVTVFSVIDGVDATSQAAAAGTTAAPIGVSAVQALYAQDLVSRINAERTGRASFGVTIPTLLVDPSLTAYAQGWSAHLASAGTVADPPLSSCSGPATQLCIMAANSGSTGNGYWPGDGSDGMDGLYMASAPHRQNMLGAAYNEVGVGVTCSGGRAWTVEVFGYTYATIPSALARQNGQNYLQGQPVPAAPVVAGAPSGAPVYCPGQTIAASGAVTPTGGQYPYPFRVASIAGEPNLPASTVGIAATADANGYWLAHSDGSLSAHGDAVNYGSMAGTALNAPISHIVATGDGRGYWMVASDGGIFSFGDAGFYGSMGAKHLNAPVVGIAPTASGHGYWLVATDGGVFSFGDAVFHGSMGGLHLNAPVVGIAADNATGGYWMVASDGGVFAFGAPFDGSAGNLHLNRPVNGMATTANAQGYWFVASDGGIFAFGNAAFRGSAGATSLNAPVVGMAGDSATGGYWLVGADGGVFSYGAPFLGAG